MKRIKLIFLLALFVTLVACSNTSTPSPEPNPPEPPPNPGSLEISVNTIVKPIISMIEGLEEGDAPRPVSAFVLDGDQSNVVANELLIAVESQEELDTFLTRWNGEVLDSLERLVPEDPLEFLVKIDPRKADASVLAAFAANLFALEPEHSGLLSVADNDLLGLLAIAAYETVTFGTEVTLNVLADQQAIQDGTSDESVGPPGNFETEEDRMNFGENAFDWSYMRYDSAQSTGVDVAWKLLHEADKLDNSVNIMIHDGGFYPNLDFPNVKKIRKGQWESENLWDCGNSSCPWHGTNVVIAAMGTLDNQYGAAGPAGPIHSRLTAVSLRKGTWRNLRRIQDVVSEERPDILNMSYGSTIKVFKGTARRMVDRRFRNIHNNGVLSFSSAGNNGKNVDGSDFIIPCQSKYVVCVGGMEADTTTRANNSNYGTNKNNRSVEIYGPYQVYTVDDAGNAGIVANKRNIRGTSFASPFVAGVAALVKAADPKLSHDEIKAILFETAHVGGVGVSGYERRINAFGAVSKALNLPDYKEPTISISSLKTGDSFGINEFIDFSGEARDFRGNKLPILWGSLIDGELGPPTTIGLGGTLSEGNHVIVARATDIAGTTVQALVTIEVGNTPSVMKILTPTPTTQIYENTPFDLKGISEDPDNFNNMLPNNKVRWLIRRASNNNLVYDQTGHNRLLSLSQPGTYKVTFRGDDNGKISEDKVTITVLAVPEGQTVPVATIFKPDNGDDFVYVGGQSSGITLDLNGKGSDAENGNLSGTRLRWTAIDEKQKVTVLCEGSGFATGGGLTVLNNCAKRTVELDPEFYSDGVANYVIRLEVKDFSGFIGTDEVNISVGFVVP